jgi:chemotaxis family two-component system sensor kinase Cph1
MPISQLLEKRPEQSAFDLTNCDREPIHIPGAIQPHGFLFHINHGDYSILQLSRNLESLLKQKAEELVNRPLESLLTQESFERIRSAVESDAIKKSNPFAINFRGLESKVYDGVLRSYKGALILELEDDRGESDNLFSFYQTIRRAVVDLQNSHSISSACATAASQIRKITGFDRVTVYKFDQDWNGNVIGEDRSDSMDSLLGQRFPASDIPAQARALYQLNWIRIISDRSYTPAPLYPQMNPLTEQPLDLSLSVLRSVSPIHLEYMKNMRMAASMSVSIMKDGQLWGLISCHHSQPKYLGYQIRSACEFLAEIFSGQMGTIETREASNQRTHLKGILSGLESILSGVADFASAFKYNEAILNLTNSSGAVLYHRGKIHSYGECPDEEKISQLLTWLSSQKSDIFHTRSLKTQYPGGEAIRELASGLLSVRISRNPDSYILWIRAEKVKAIDWAGNPSKPVEEVKGELRLHPRKSFELWREIVRGQAESYTESEIEVALEFRNMIISKLLAHSVRDLESSNLELDSFAQMVSHDLREPLRGIRIYAKHSMEDDKGKLSKSTEERLGNMIALSEDLDSLLLSLYSFSKIGRVELSFENVSVLEIAQQVIARIKPICEEQGIEIEVVGHWPHLFCDRIRTGEIFQNLVLNAVRYSDKAKKKIILKAEMRKEHGNVYVFSVEDNGIGIDSAHFQDIFQLFKRLHTKEEFPGGTGSGLTMTRRLVEKHGGKIWLDSVEGEGSTFYFTLQPQG